MSFKEMFTQTISDISYKVQEKSPEILVVAGVVGLVGAAVLACRATIKAQEVVKDSKEVLDKIHEYENDKELAESGEYTKKDAKKDKTVLAVKTVMKIGRHYILPVIIAVLSIIAIFYSHNIMVTRNAAISAAYTSLATSFNDYRKRVIEKFGEQTDKELKYGLKAEKVEEEYTDENGKTKKKKVTKVVAPDDLGHSPYAKFFDASSCLWADDPEYNMTVLREIEMWCNKELRSRGGRPLYLNEVYDKLDLERTDAGQRVGWRYLPNTPGHLGDNYVSFGIDPMFRKADETDEAYRRFINGLEPVVLLDFNVDGEVFETPFTGRPFQKKQNPHVYGH